MQAPMAAIVAGTAPGAMPSIQKRVSPVYDCELQRAEIVEKVHERLNVNPQVWCTRDL
jgi:hypothetical protein